MRLFTLLLGIAALACGKTSEIAADDPDGSAGSSGAGAQGGSAGSNGSGGTAGSAGASGNGGSSGSSGSAGSGGSGGSGDFTHYHGCELPTGAIRYGVYKADPARDLCFLVVIGPSNTFLPSIQVTPPSMGVESAAVWQGAASCGGYPPPQTGTVEANGGSGDITITQAAPPATLDLDVTLAFPQTESWVPASEKIDPDPVVTTYDCSGCEQRATAYAALIQNAVQPGGGPNGCSSAIRLDYTSKELLSHAVVCDVYSPTSEGVARSTAEKALKMAPGSDLVSGPSTDQWLFRGTLATAIPEADGIVAAVSPRTGKISFGGNIGWFGVGDAIEPKSWRDTAELGGGCPALPKPPARGFEVHAAQGQPELPAAEVNAVLDVVWATALPQGIVEAWGHGAFDAMVVLYPKTLGAAPGDSEWVVLLNHGVQQ